MKNLLILGAGRVGRLAGGLLAESGDYNIHLADKKIQKNKINIQNNTHKLTYIELDANKNSDIESYILENKIIGVISCLPFFYNIGIAQIAKKLSIHYFDLTEDVKTTDAIERIALDSSTIFAPQCGLAPGFISIVANELMQDFEKVDEVRMRVGALPLNVTNSLQYGLTWSTEGIVNEYAQPCKGIVDGKIKILNPLADTETIKIDGLTYEAFNTSGGVGSMINTYNGKVQNMTYKSVRYPGHGEKIRFLMNDMKLSEDLPQMCKIMDKAVPRISQDMVLIYVSVNGIKHGLSSEQNFAQKFPSKTIFGQRFSALQLTTATSLCVTVDLALANEKFNCGFLKQEAITLPEFYDNRFGVYYKNEGLLSEVS
jgi:saccharopine dehydrogenase-like NADP-dependent oxidoreductase